MKKNQQKLTYKTWLQQSSVRVGRIFFALSLIYAVTIVLYDAFQLITPDMLLIRWIAVAGFVIVTALLWFAARAKPQSELFYSRLIYGYVLLSIVFASVNVYIQRGMASRAVILYVVPILVASFLLRRVAVFAATIIAGTAYVLSSVWYAINNPSEGYKIELYGEVGFYTALLFVVAYLAWDVIRSKNADDS